MTRLPLPSAGPAAVAPAFDPLWTQTSTADRVRLSRSKRDTNLNSISAKETSALALNVLMRQYVSDPLDAQLISGTVRMIARTIESASGANFRSQLALRVVSHDGATVRGTLLAPDALGTLTSEWATGGTNRKFPMAYPAGGAVLSDVECQDDDRLVVEAGYRSHNTSTTGRSGTIRFGDPVAVGDCAENETGTADLCPWIEFSADLVWRHNPGRVWVFPGFEVAVTPDEQTGAVDRVSILSAPAGMGTRRVVCENDWWDVPEGDSGEKLRPTASPPSRLAVG